MNILHDEDSMTDYWRDVRVSGQAKRAESRKSSAEALIQAGIPFTTNNEGAHLIVTGLGMTVDFWPGTGLWIVRGRPKRNYGVRRLIDALTPVNRPCK